MYYTRKIVLGSGLVSDLTEDADGLLGGTQSLPQTLRRSRGDVGLDMHALIGCACMRVCVCVCSYS